MKKISKILLTSIVLSCILGNIAFADCQSSEECITADASFTMGKINNTLRAVYFELKQTNTILRKRGGDTDGTV